MLSACFFYFPAQRLVMALMGPLHSGAIAAHTGLGPWQEWSFEDYKTFFGVTIWLTGYLVLTVALLKAYTAAPKPKAS